MGTRESYAMYGRRHGTLPGANIVLSFAWMRMGGMIGMGGMGGMGGWVV